MGSPRFDEIRLWDDFALAGKRALAISEQRSGPLGRLGIKAAAVAGDQWPVDGEWL